MLQPQSFWEKFFQFYLAIASFFSLLYGLALTMLGVYCRYNPETFGYGFEYTSSLLCLIGGAIIFISILGCCGASCESRRMTVSYALSQSILMLCQWFLFSYLLFSFKEAENISVALWNSQFSDSNKLAFMNMYKCFDDISEENLKVVLPSLGVGSKYSSNVPQGPCSVMISQIVASWYYFLLLSVGCIIIIGVRSLAFELVVGN